VAPVFGSREAPIEGVSGALVADAATARGHRHSRYLGTREEVLPALEQTLRDGDLLITMGAGDILHAGEDWLKAGEGA
jgi:UDP-N-acetylmuramate--alanine ligase